MNPLILLAAHVQQLIDFGDHVAFNVSHDGLKLGLELGLCLGLEFYFCDPLRRDVKSCFHRAPSGFLETYGCGFVPDNVIGAEIFDEHDHKPGIAHGIKRAAKMGADIVAVKELEPHFHFNRAKIRSNASHTNSSAKEWRPPAQAPQQAFDLLRRVQVSVFLKYQKCFGIGAVLYSRIGNITSYANVREI